MILDLRDMIVAAREGGYALPVFEVAGVALARAAVEAAADMDSPVILHPVRDEDLLMPALVALAKRAPVPVIPVIGGITSEDDAARAIRLGAGGLICP
ncbi:MAG TPA: class II fructose-bisphosphate aldolase, partial [Candidatus Omnitrophota bacterium]|nr:class II fructose-bisphosphate aldolase [Candidatus Omnitrophota bacterium]